MVNRDNENILFIDSSQLLLLYHVINASNSAFQKFMIEYIAADLAALLIHRLLILYRKI